MSAPGSRTGVESPGVPPLLRTTCRVCALALMAGLAITPYLLETLRTRALTQFFFWAQDALWIAVAALLLFALPVVRLPVRPADLFDALARHVRRTAFVLAAGVVAIAALGTFTIFRGFALTRDEIMAEFDALILRSGRLVATLPPDWAALKDALNPEFLLPVGGPVWVSGYLPGNAALRAAVGSVIDAGWTSPLLAGIAMLALYRIARRLWPERPDAVVVSLVVLAASSQVLVMAMTSYAMTAHLALDLVWLALFLRDDRIGHAGAVAVGALAVGLHQIVFHPLFVAPFILHLLFHGRRRLAIGYIIAYAAIGAFWASYWTLALQGIGAGDAAAAGLGADWLATRVAQLLANFRADGVASMLANLLRFVAWQHVLLVPLACAAVAAIRRDQGLARPLAGGIVLTLVAMFVLLPYQGHGWGYRYLHGLLGNACLLAGYGWIAVTAGAAPRQRAAAWSVFAATSAVAVLVMLPVHVAQAVRIVAPYRAAVAEIERTSADVVLVDVTGTAFAADLVRNDPLLRNRPKVLALDFVDERQLAALCARYTVAVFDQEQASALGIMAASAEPADALRARRRAFLRQIGCGARPAVARAP